MYENIFLGEILSLGEKLKIKKGGFWGFLIMLNYMVDSSQIAIYAIFLNGKK
jgi:hypothetical protein